MNIHYEPHPVSPERKAELRAQGFKIIDARFKPAKSKQEQESKQDEKPSKSLTVEQLTTALIEKGIEAPAGAKKADLAKLLDEA